MRHPVVAARIAASLRSVRIPTRLRRDRRAVTAIEYGLIAALVAAVIVGGLTAIGAGVGASLGSLGNALQ